MKSKLYKLVENNIIIAEGSKGEMKRAHKEAQKAGLETFVGVGSPLSTLGKVWDSRKI